LRWEGGKKEKECGDHRGKPRIREKAEGRSHQLKISLLRKWSKKQKKRTNRSGSCKLIRERSAGEGGAISSSNLSITFCIVSRVAKKGGKKGGGGRKPCGAKDTAQNFRTLSYSLARFPHRLDETGGKKRCNQ